MNCQTDPNVLTFKMGFPTKSSGSPSCLSAALTAVTFFPFLGVPSRRTWWRSGTELRNSSWAPSATPWRWTCGRCLFRWKNGVLNGSPNNLVSICHHSPKIGEPKFGTLHVDVFGCLSICGVASVVQVGCNFGELLLKRPLLPGKCEENKENPPVWRTS